jgi:hypothetical protein
MACAAQKYVCGVWDTRDMTAYDQLPWLLELATRHRGERVPTEGVYDRARQMRVRGDRGVMSLTTKKADREAGEDQKDRW